MARERSEESVSLTLSRQIDVICGRFEAEFRAGTQPRIESFLYAFPEAHQPALLKELLRLELDLVSPERQTMLSADYLKRFPRHVDLIQDVMASAATSGRPLEPGQKSTHSGMGSPNQLAPDTASRPGRKVTSTVDASLPEGSELGRYRIERVLGSGAMGFVYLAKDSQIGRNVALKIPRKSVLEQPGALERFYREARMLGTLHHPNICPVYDVGAIGDTHYLTMAYIVGKPMSSLIRTEKLLSPKQIATLIRKIALALEEAHQHGVIHRDLKPANIMLDSRNEPVVMDFGLARQINTTEEARITQDGAILGTPVYMAPEQVRSELDRIGPTSDIYALGVIMYQFLTGELPFNGPLLSVLAQIMTEQPKRPSEIRADVDPSLEAICLKMMSKEIDQRYPSMKAVASALTGILRTAPKAGASAEVAQSSALTSVANVAVAPKVDPPADPPKSFKPQAEFAIEAPDELPARHRKSDSRRQSGGRKSSLPPWRVLAGGLAGGLLLLLGVIIWIRSGDALVKVEVHSSDVEVTFQNETIKLTDGERDYRVTPGDHTLHIKSGNAEFDTGKFTLKKGHNPAVTVQFVEGEIVAKLGEQPIEHDGNRGAGSSDSETTNLDLPKAITADSPRTSNGPTTLAPRQPPTPVRVIAPGKWQPLVDDTTPLPDPEIWSYKDGVLKGGNGKKLNHFQMSYIKLDSIEASDVIMRSRITVTQPVVSGCGFDFRLNDKGGYYAWCHNWFGMGRSLKGQPHQTFTDIKTKQFHPKEVDWAVAAIGDQLLIYANGERIYEKTSKDHTRGTLSLNVKHTGGTFIHPEVMVLDGVPNVTKEWIDQAVQKRMNEWISGTASVEAAATSTTPKLTSTSSTAPVSPAKHVRMLGAGYCMDARVTADGKYIATVDLGGLMKWWNADSGELIRTIGKHGSRVDELALVANGQLAASGGFDRGEVKLWDVNTETDSLLTLPGTGKWGVDLEGTCDGRHLIVRANGAVRLYRITVTPPATGSKDATANTDLPIEIAEKSLVGRATASFGEIEIYSLGEMKSSGPIATSTSNPDWIYFGLPNSDSTICLWDIKKSRELCQFKGPTKMPHKLWLSGDGKYLVACGGIPSSFVWDASTGKLIQTVVGDSVTALSPDGDRLLIHQWQSPVYEEWELNGPRKLRQFNAQRKDFVHHVYYVNASRIVAATAAGAEIWEVPSPPVAKPTAEKLAEWAKSRYSIPVTRSLAGHSKLPLKLVFSRDGSRLLSASEDGTLRYWNTASAESLVTLNGHKGAVTCCALSADGKQALSGGLDDIVRWWDLEAGTQLAEFKGHGAAIYAVAFDAGSNEAVSVSANNTICRWSLAEKNEASRFTASQIRGYGGPKDVVNLLGGSFTPDAKHVLVPGYFGTIHLLDTKSQTEAGKFGAWGFRDMTFSEDGTLMACTSEHSLSVWDVATKTQKVELQGKNGGQRGVAFTRDGKRLIVGANNQPTRVWDIESKAVIGELSTKANGWSAIAASPDGQWAASGGDNGKILLWPLSWLTE